MRTLTCPPNAEIIGLNIRAFSDNLQAEFTRPIMEKYDIADVEPYDWYPAINLLDALNEVASNPNVTTNLVAIGMEIGEITRLPPEMENPTLPDVLYVWNDLYQDLHRNADMGGIECEQVNEKHYITVHTHPYPDDMSYGTLYGFARRFLPHGTRFTVYFDKEFPARDYGGDTDSTILHVQWE